MHRSATFNYLFSELVGNGMRNLLLVFTRWTTAFRALLSLSVFWHLLLTFVRQVSAFSTKKNDRFDIKQHDDINISRIWLASLDFYLHLAEIRSIGSWCLYRKGFRSSVFAKTFCFKHMSLLLWTMMFKLLNATYARQILCPKPSLWCWNMMRQRTCWFHFIFYIFFLQAVFIRYKGLQCSNQLIVS